VESQSALHSCDSAPTGQNVIAWGNAPGKGKAKTKALTGRNQRCCTALFRPVGALLIGWPRPPRAMPWAFTLWAFGPEPHGAWNRNRRCTLAIPPRMGQNVIAWGNAPGKDWVAPYTQGDALGFHLVGLWPGTAWCVESQSALHSCDSAPNGAKCDSLGQRPRKRQSKNQSPNGAEPTVLHRVVPPHWGFSTGWPRTPRAMPWAFTLWAFGPESHCA